MVENRNTWLSGDQKTIVGFVKQAYKAYKKRK